MKNTITFLFIITILSIFISSCETDSMEVNTLESVQNKSDMVKSQNCATIQSGKILYPNERYLVAGVISTGFNVYGYNYQAHSFKGLYANLYLGEIDFPPYNGEDEDYIIQNPDIENNPYFMNNYWPYRNDEVVMNWNDAWLSNKDCNGDEILDTYYGYDSYIGSGAWQIYHSKGTYSDEEGNECNWTYFSKIIAVPEDATFTDGIWYNADGIEIGRVFWDQLAFVQEVINDPCGGKKGAQFVSPDRAGMGNR